MGRAIADRLLPFGVDVVGVARTRREGALGFDGLDDVLPGAAVLVDMLPLTTETTGIHPAGGSRGRPDGALFVNAGRGPDRAHDGARPAS